jgi:hypothetical protein
MTLKPDKGTKEQQLSVRCPLCKEEGRTEAADEMEYTENGTAAKIGDKKLGTVRFTMMMMMMMMMFMLLLMLLLMMFMLLLLMMMLLMVVESSGVKSNRITPRQPNTP